MPIEFNCRFCGAMIRVPDRAAGGKGRCPKCNLSITVPKKSAKKPVAESPAPVPTFDFPDVAAEAPVVKEQTTTDDPSEVVELEAVDGDQEEIAIPSLDDLPVEPPRSKTSRKVAARILKQRRFKSLLQGLAGLIVLAIFAAVAFFTIFPILTNQRLTGEFAAGTAENLELPFIIIEKSRINSSSNDLDSLLKKLELSPLPMVSNSMRIELAGTPKGLKVSVAAGAQAHFYRVNFKSNEAVQKYLSENEAQLDQQRQHEVDQAAAEFFVEYEKVLAKTSTAENLSVFRDRLAVPSLVRGFGHSVVAGYGRGLYRCIYEDPDGNLYFLLPAGAQEFEVRGRENADGHLLVPAEFKVTVKGGIDLPPVEVDPKQTKPSTSSKKPSKEPKSDDDTPDGKN